MKRWFLASALLFTSAGLTSADYVVIIANVGASKELRTQPARGMGGFRGMGGMAGTQGMPPGGPGPGMMGNQGGPRPGMGGGMPGMGGMQGMGGGMAGMGGMQGMAGMQGMGGMMGMRGGMMGMRGGMMGGGMMGGGMMGGGEIPEVDDVPEFIIAIVAVEPVNPNNDINKRLTDKRVETPSAKVTHKWGGSTLLAKTGFAETIVLTNDSDHKPLKAVGHQFDKKFEELFKSKPSADLVLDLADWTLAHGLVDKFPQVMDKLVELDKTHPAAIAYLKIKADLDRQVKDEDPPWRSKLLSGYKVDDTGHYTIVYNATSTLDVRSHRELLENSFRGFYYWFALKGIVQPVPIHRQVVVLTGQQADFNHLHKILTSGPVVVDGFFARRENLAVMASQRQDEAYDSLKKFWKKWKDRDFRATEILSRDPRTHKSGVPANTNSDQVHQAQMVALMLKALEQEAELATISHDASRQLLFASGLLPRNVAAPEWILFGMGSFFETPLQSPWAGIAAPSAYYLPRWKEMKSKGLEKKPGDTLRKVITDGYFRTLPPEGKADSAERHLHDAALRKARTTSWSLTYFLAKQKLDGLQRYFKELSKMPRDIELDDEILLGGFARAFGKVDGNNKVDMAKLNALEDEWFGYMKNVKFESESTMKKIQTIFKDRLAQMQRQEKGNGGQGQVDPITGRPMQPGGFGPGMNPQGPGGFRPPAGGAPGPGK